MRTLRHRLYAVLALAYLTGVIVTSFHRATWRQFKAGVRGIWATTGESQRRTE